MTWTRAQKQSAVVLAIFVAGLAYVSFRGDPDSPEALVKKAVKAMVLGAEEKDLGPFKSIISEDFRDESDRSKAEVLNILRAIFLRHPTISLNILKLEATQSSNPQLYEVQLELFMSETSLPSERGEFLLTFRQEGNKWRMWSARWGGGYGY